MPYKKQCPGCGKYQSKTHVDMFYVNGYNKAHNVAEKNTIRQNKISDILNPKKFWHYDAVNKKCKNISEGME